MTSFNTLGNHVADLHNSVAVSKDEADQIKEFVALERNRLISQINASMDAVVASLNALTDNLDKLTSN
jgi:hypothetical protein